MILIETFTIFQFFSTYLNIQEKLHKNDVIIQSYTQKCHKKFKVKSEKLSRLELNRLHVDLQRENLSQFRVQKVMWNIIHQNHFETL